MAVFWMVVGFCRAPSAENTLEPTHRPRTPSDSRVGTPMCMCMPSCDEQKKGSDGEEHRGHGEDDMERAVRS